MFSFKRFVKFTAIASMIAVAGGACYQSTRPTYDGAAGITFGSAYAPARNHEVDFDIWYPALLGGGQVTVGGNGDFYGAPAGRGAK
jgi:hypothetical protein